MLQSIFEKLIQVSKRGRPNIEPVISFLCIIITESTNEVKSKFRRVFQYLKQTIGDKRIMGADILSRLGTWVNATYVLQTDLKIHTRNGITFGYGMIHCNSRNQKLNKKSSTEARSFGVSDYLPYNIWICLFMGAQGYGIKQNILFKYNHSSINMEKNGKNSCTGNSRPIDIFYLFVKERVENIKGPCL